MRLINGIKGFSRHQSTHKFMMCRPYVFTDGQKESYERYIANDVVPVPTIPPKPVSDHEGILNHQKLIAKEMVSNFGSQIDAMILATRSVRGRMIAPRVGQAGGSVDMALDRILGCVEICMGEIRRVCGLNVDIVGESLTSCFEQEEDTTGMEIDMAGMIVGNRSQLVLMKDLKSSIMGDVQYVKDQCELYDTTISHSPDKRIVEHELMERVFGRIDLIWIGQSKLYDICCVLLLDWDDIPLCEPISPVCIEIKL